MHLQYDIVTIKIIFLDTIYLRLIFHLQRFHYLFFSGRQSISRWQQWYCLEEKAEFCCYFWRLEAKDDLHKTSSLSEKCHFKQYASKLWKFVLGFILLCVLFWLDFFSFCSSGSW